MEKESLIFIGKTILSKFIFQSFPNAEKYMKIPESSHNPTRRSCLLKTYFYYLACQRASRNSNLNARQSK